MKSMHLLPDATSDTIGLGFRDKLTEDFWSINSYGGVSENNFVRTFTATSNVRITFQRLLIWI